MSNLTTNYKPISLLSIVNKVLERVMHNRFNKQNILYIHQFGFRKKNHSTAMALIEIIDKILEGLDRGNVVAALYLVFDTVDHTILLQNCITMAYVAMYT
jgi:hypothetical protein